MSKCPHCGMIFYYADYDAGREKIYCTGCKEELPSRENAVRTPHTEIHISSTRLDIVGFHEVDKPLSWTFDPYEGITVGSAPAPLLEVKKRVVYKGEDMGSVSRISYIPFVGWMGKVKTVDGIYNVRSESFSDLTVSQRRELQCKVHYSRESRTPAVVSFSDQGKLALPHRLENSSC